MNQVLERCREQIQEGWPGLRRPVCVIDGSSVQLMHRPELVESFPPGHNQHGENHWPILKIVVYHDAVSGLAWQPSWGPMYGAEAVSEQSLAREALQRLPADAVVIVDGNFGIFTFVSDVQRSGRDVIARLTKERAMRMLGPKPLGCGSGVELVWEASRWDRKNNSELPAGVQIRGWIHVFKDPSHNGWIYLFTTLPLPTAQVIEMYKLRWNIETDLRSLKQTVAIHQLGGQSVDVVEKELLLAVAAYNLVRAVMCLAAQRVGLRPRQLSFSRVYGVLQAILPHLTQNNSAAELDYWLERLLDHAARCKLPQRSVPRSYPREVWGGGGKFPARKRATSPSAEVQ